MLLLWIQVDGWLTLEAPTAAIAPLLCLRHRLSACFAAKVGCLFWERPRFGTTRVLCNALWEPTLLLDYLIFARKMGCIVVIVARIGQ